MQLNFSPFLPLFYFLLQFNFYLISKSKIICTSLLYDKNIMFTQPRLVCTVCSSCRVECTDSVELTYHYLRHSLLEVAQALATLQVRYSRPSPNSSLMNPGSRHTSGALIQTLATLQVRLPWLSSHFRCINC